MDSDPLLRADWQGLARLHHRAEEIPALLDEMARGPDDERDATLHEARDILFDTHHVRRLAGVLIPLLVERLRTAEGPIEPRHLHLLRGLAKGGWLEPVTSTDVPPPPGPPPTPEFIEQFGNPQTADEPPPPRSPDEWMTGEEAGAAMRGDWILDPRFVDAPDPRVRVAAAALAPLVADPGAGLRVLTRMLESDADPHARASAAMAIGAYRARSGEAPERLADVLADRAARDGSPLVRTAAGAARAAMEGLPADAVWEALEVGLGLAPLPSLDFPWEQPIAWENGCPACAAVRALGALIDRDAGRVAQVLERHLRATVGEGEKGARTDALRAYARATLGRLADRGWGETRAEELDEDERRAAAVLADVAPPAFRVGHGLPLPKDLRYFLDPARPLNRPLEIAGEAQPLYVQLRRLAYRALDRAAFLAALRERVEPVEIGRLAEDVDAGVYAEPPKRTILPLRDPGLLRDAPAR